MELDTAWVKSEDKRPHIIHEYENQVDLETQLTTTVIGGQKSVMVTLVSKTPYDPPKEKWHKGIRWTTVPPESSRYV